MGFSASSFGVGSLMPTNETPLGSQAQAKACGQTGPCKADTQAFPSGKLSRSGGSPGGEGVWGN